ncbi:hypothetical protein BV898_14119 [Hypsibius exemplaris]|uniref:Uncharacterized protein n=1 Tax=Hypsibius exemplaris TaxID=2072580 RepID=A0A1W0W8P5_HYPEX|nr:hypothetical protein BV898_14119 [Hypsibius exemplaris]
MKSTSKSGNQNSATVPDEAAWRGCGSRFWILFLSPHFQPAPKAPGLDKGGVTVVELKRTSTMYTMCSIFVDFYVFPQYILVVSHRRCHGSACQDAEPGAVFRGSSPRVRCIASGTGAIANSGGGDGPDVMALTQQCSFHEVDAWCVQVVIVLFCCAPVSNSDTPVRPATTEHWASVSHLRSDYLGVVQLEWSCFGVGDPRGPLRS